MFTTGIILNYNVFQHKISLNNSKSYTGLKKSNPPFIFYPNTFVTKFMFNKISF